MGAFANVFPPSSHSFADGILLKEVNRLLRPNGYFVYSAPPAYKKDKQFPMIWDKLVNLTGAMCWKLIAKKVQTAIWIKQNDQSCLQHNVEEKLLNLCETTDESKPSWNVPLQNCISLSTAEADSEKLPPRPERLSLYSKSLGKLGLSNIKKFFVYFHDIMSNINSGLERL